MIQSSVALEVVQILTATTTLMGFLRKGLRHRLLLEDAGGAVATFVELVMICLAAEAVPVL